MIFISIKKLPNSLVNKIFCDTKDHIALIYIFETQITDIYIFKLHIHFLFDYSPQTYHVKVLGQFKCF